MAVEVTEHTVAHGCAEAGPPSEAVGWVACRTRSSPRGLRYYVSFTLVRWTPWHWRETW